MQRVVAAFVFALTLAAAGCGSSASTSAVDPALLAPKTTLAYASFELSPQGDERADFDTAFGKLLGADPETGLGHAFTEAAQTSGGLDYESDVKPWLGDTITGIVTGLAGEHPDYALLVASTDDDKARAAIDKDLAGAHATERAYRDVSYKSMDDGTVNGVVDGFLVAGTEPAFKAVVDTSKDGESLADSQQWKDSVGDRGEGKIGLAYVDAKALLQSAASRLPGAQRVAAPLLLSLVHVNPFVATLDATPDSLVVDVSSPGTKADPRGPAAASSPLIESLPSDSWLALALPDVGRALGRVAGALRSNPLIASQYQGVLAGVRTRTGVDLQRDVFDSVGDIGAFIRGKTKATVNGAVVVESTRPNRLGRKIALLPRLPAEVRVTSVGGRVIVAHGPGATRAAQSRARALGSTDLFRTAADALGSRPTLFVDFAPALRLAAASPHHRNDPHFQHVLPRLQHLEYLVVGARRDGDLDVVRAVLGLR